VLPVPPKGKASVQYIERARDFLSGEDVLAKLIEVDLLRQLLLAPPLSDCAQAL